MRDHLLPAALLGRFSNTVTGPARGRRVWYSSRSRTEARPRKADGVGWVNHLYTVPADEEDGTSRAVDESWGRYETGIPAALDDLTTFSLFNGIDLQLWLHVTLPLVAGLYVRGIDFDHAKQVYRLGEPGQRLIQVDEVSNRNLARPAEQTRLLAPLMAGHWEVVHFPDAELVTSDRGFALSTAPGHTQPTGVVVPVSRHAAVVVSVRPRGQVAYVVAGQWRRPVTHRTETNASAESLNGAIARSCSDFVIGATEEVVDSVAADLAAPEAIPGGPLHTMWGTDDELALNQVEWWQLRSALSWPPDDSVHGIGDFKMNPAWKQPAIEWQPTAFVTPGRPRGLTGLRKFGPHLELDLGVARTVRDASRQLHDFR